jgi:hypothetical protein
MKTTGASIKQPKQRGARAELRFVARAAQHGFSISKPLGDGRPYDFIVKHAGKFVRVQVKSTVCQKRKSYAYLKTLYRVSASSPVLRSFAPRAGGDTCPYVGLRFY